MSTNEIPRDQLLDQVVRNAEQRIAELEAELGDQRSYIEICHRDIVALGGAPKRVDLERAREHGLDPSLQVRVCENCLRASCLQDINPCEHPGDRVWLPVWALERLALEAPIYWWAV